MFYPAYLLPFFFVRCCDDPLPFIIVRDIDPEIQQDVDDNGYLYRLRDTLPPDTLLINANPGDTYVACNTFPFGRGLIKQARATKCPKDGKEGLKHEIYDINVQLRSNSNHYDVTDSVYLINYYSKNGYSVREWLEKNNKRFPMRIGLPAFKTRDSVFRAYLRYIFINEDTVAGVTDSFIWKMN